MKGVLSAGLMLGVMTTLSGADIPIFGRSARLLQIQDVTSIRTLAGRDILAIEAERDQVLPEAWLAVAYLAPDSEAGGIRRGRILDLKTLLKDARATEWRVTSHDGRYAQVAAFGRPFSNSVTGDDVDRPFRMFGDFSDTELAGVISYVRSSPRKSPIPDDPDGTSHVDYPDRLDGRVPLVELRRVDRNTVEVFMGRERSNGYRAVLHYRNRSWHLGEIAFYMS